MKFSMLPNKASSARIMLSRLHCVAKKIMETCGKSDAELRIATSTEINDAFDGALQLLPEMKESMSFSYYYQKYM
jgi:hypothetical protein